MKVRADVAVLLYALVFTQNSAECPVPDDGFCSIPAEPSWGEPVPVEAGSDCKKVNPKTVPPGTEAADGRLIDEETRKPCQG